MTTNDLRLSPFSGLQLGLAATFLLSAIDPIGGWLGNEFAMNSLSVGRFGAILNYSIEYVPSVIMATMIVLTSQLHRRQWPLTPGGRRLLAGGLHCCETSFGLVLLTAALGITDSFVLFVYLALGLMYLGRLLILIGGAVCFFQRQREKRRNDLM